MDRKHRFYSIKHEGITFEVSGDWEEYQKATRYEPEEGGCFFDCTVKVEELEGENDFTELLDSKIVEQIIAEAEEALREL